MRPPPPDAVVPLPAGVATHERGGYGGSEHGGGCRGTTVAAPEGEEGIMTSGVKVVGGAKVASDQRRHKGDASGSGAAAGVAAAGMADTGVADTGVADAEVAAAGVADTGVADTGEHADGTASSGAAREKAVPSRRATNGPAGTGPAKGRQEPDTGRRSGRRRRAGVAALALLAVLGVAGTVGFGVAWEGLHATQGGESQARSAARSFLVDLTNFNAKTVDADFSAVSSMATGAFATQAQRFFNSTIRQELQKALASSRGQIRALYVQSYGGGAATVYAVMDQLYVNDKLKSPQTDVLRMVVDLSQVAGRWKVANVTVLQGPSLGSSSPTSSSPGGS
jgi:hypothetical protein